MLQMTIKYPTRCEIVDVTGQEVFPGIEGKTPDVSKPHVGERGLAERIDDGNVKITLDNGTVLYGYECWWKPTDDPLIGPPRGESDEREDNERTCTRGAG